METAEFGQRVATPYGVMENQVITDEKWQFNQVPIIGATITGWKFVHIMFNSVKFVSCKFLGCSFYFCNFENVRFIDCTFDTDCTLDSVVFDGEVTKSQMYFTVVSSLLLFGSDKNIIQPTIFEHSLFQPSGFVPPDGSSKSGLSRQLEPVVPAGDLIVYKKLANDKIATLLIPARYTRTRAFGNKFRATKAKVLNIQYKNGVPCERGVSIINNAFEYVVGGWVKPTRKFERNWWEECASGIHFFLTRKEAEAFNL